MIETVIQKHLPLYSFAPYNQYELTVFWAAISQHCQHDDRKILITLCDIIADLNWGGIKHQKLLKLIIDDFENFLPYLRLKVRLNAVPSAYIFVWDESGNKYSILTLMMLACDRLNGAKLCQFVFSRICDFDFIMKRELFDE